jgi:peptidoglycan/LPS O-acetylase OafA/YrhL
MASLLIYLYNPNLINSSGGVTDIFASFTLIPTDDKLLINNGWTLTYEFLFYFIFYFCMFFKNKEYVCFAALILLSIYGAFTTQTDVYLYHLTSPLLFEFALGILAFFIIVKSNIPFIYSLTLVLISLLLLSLGFTSLGYSNDYERVISGGVPMFILFIGVVSLENKITMNVRAYCRPVYLIGMSSYSLYLFHPFVLAGLTKALSYVDLTKYHFVYFSCMLLGSLLSSYYLYKYVEIPASKRL